MFHVDAQPQLLDYTRQNRSPLALRNPNACPRLSAFMNPEVKSFSQCSEDSRRSARNPLLQKNAKQLQDQKRQVFLNKVRQASEDKRWQHRSDQILRQEFLARQKRWQKEQAASAPDAPPTLEEEPEEHSNPTSFFSRYLPLKPAFDMPTQEVNMVDRILSQQEQELEALISSIQQEQENTPQYSAREDHEPAMTDYGSDEEDYDQLFMDVMSQEQESKRPISPNTIDVTKRDENLDTVME